MQGLLYKIRRRPTLPPVTAIPSALAGLTALFGMGRGGHRRYRHLNIVVRTADIRYALIREHSPEAIRIARYEIISWHIYERKKRTRCVSRTNSGNTERNNRAVFYHCESFGLLVSLGFDLSTFTPMTYQRCHLQRPYKEVSSRG